MQAPEPVRPPLLQKEFQNYSSASKPFLVLIYSVSIFARTGISASHHHWAKALVHLFMMSCSAFFLKFDQSYSVPSSVMDGKPHFVIILNEKKCCVASITVTWIAIFSAGVVLEKAGTSSSLRPGTKLFSSYVLKQSGLPSTTLVQLLPAFPFTKSSQTTVSVFLPSWVTHLLRTSSCFWSTCKAIAYKISNQKC